MLRNNNLAVVTHMAKSSLKSNPKRSMTMIFAVLLSAFMIFSVFTVGITFFTMQRIQNIRLSGADFDAIMYGVTEEQREKCEQNPDIVKTGVCAVAGYVEETSEDKTPNVGLVWADPVYWEMMQPAMEEVKGSYPEKEDEVLVTKEALKECGYENLEVGDTFAMTYSTPNGRQEKLFRISGMWDGYGTKKVFYMSEAFYKETGYKVSEVSSGRFFMDFKQQIMTQKQQDAFIDSMNLEKQQNVFFTENLGRSVQILLVIVGLALITCICAYLLIYNIMYLSVTGNIRYYGLLQTIGMTGRQIRYFVRQQMLLIGGIGIVGGLFTGGIVSFFLVPTVVKSLGIRTGQIVIAFHPAVFFLTVLLVSMTLFLASRKPAKIAVMCSPIEALGYRSKTGMKKCRKTGTGNLSFRMAKEQIRKDKKKASIIMLSLATSMSVFLCMVTLLRSQEAREFSYNYENMDMIVKNDTVLKEDREDRKNLLDDEFLEEIEKTEGVKAVYPVSFAEITVPWEPEFSDLWMQEFYDMWTSIPYEENREEYQTHPENFGSSLVGIDEAEFELLNQNMNTSVDAKKFLNGETCILYRNGLDFQDGDLKGKMVTCAQYTDSANRRTFEIAGLTDENYYTALLGYPPTIIVSDEALKKFSGETWASKVGIYYEESYDEKTETKLLSLMENDSDAKDFSYDSKIEMMKDVKKAQGNLMEVGIGIIAILAVIGIMNYINSFVSSIQNRQIELSIMESVGMTGKQMKKMLMLEGILYAAGAWGITLTAGLAVTYYLYQSMNYMGVAFAIPIAPILMAAVCVFGICIGVPLMVYRNFERKASVVERMKGFE